MNPLSCLIVDDESSARDLLKNLLADVEKIKVAGEADSVESAMNHILLQKPDVILLDIHMPREDGFVLIEKMNALGIHTKVIFVSAYEQYAIKALKVSAFDYLLKPVKKEELISSLMKLKDTVNSEWTKNGYNDLLNILGEQKKLKFQSRTGFFMVDPKTIIYCQAESNYTTMVLEGGKKHTISMNLGKVEEILPSLYFFRISRSIIINTNFLSQVDRKKHICELEPDEKYELSVSKRYLRILEDYCDRNFS